MTTMLLIGMLMEGGLMRKTSRCRSGEGSFPSGKISVLTARQEEGWLTGIRTWLIPRESDEPLRRLRLTGIWQLEETPAGPGSFPGLCDAGGFLCEGEELQEFHVSDTTGSYPAQKVSAQARLAVRSVSANRGPESLALSGASDRKNERNREEFLRWDPDIAAGFGTCWLRLCACWH